MTHDFDLLKNRGSRSRICNVHLIFKHYGVNSRLTVSSLGSISEGVSQFPEKDTNGLIFFLDSESHGSPQEGESLVDLLLERVTHAFGLEVTSSWGWQCAACSSVGFHGFLIPRHIESMEESTHAYTASRSQNKHDEHVLLHEVELAKFRFPQYALS